jgi:hypothetical protein
VTIGGVTPAPGQFTTLGCSSTATLGGVNTGPFTASTIVGTSSSAQALAVGRQGATSPGLNVDASIANCVTGLNVRSLIQGNGLLLAPISPGAAENLALDAKGTGSIVLGANTTGGVVVGAAGGPVAINGANLTATGQCRLVRQDATHLVLLPRNGNMIKINGQHYPIPAAGVVLANGTFTPNSLQYIYASVSGGNVALSNSATAHSASATAGNVGTEIMTGNDAFTLVGMVRTDGSSQFVDTLAQRFVRSWFNDNGVQGQNASNANASLGGSAPYVEVTAAMRVEFLSWANEDVGLAAHASVWGSSAAVGFQINVAPGLDGVVQGAGQAMQYQVAGSSFMPVGAQAAAVVAEGYHYVSLMGGGSSGGTTTNYQNRQITAMILRKP